MSLKEQRFGPVRFIPGDNGGRYPYCHSVYVAGAGVLIDPASNRERLREIRDQEGVRMVWLSHWHEDHFRDLDLFEGLPLWMSALDAPPLSDMDVFFDWYGIGDGPQDEKLRTYWRPILENEFHYRARTPDRVFTAETVVDLGATTVSVIPIPGHSPGHLAFYFREPAVLFMADTDLTPFGPWYGDRYSSIEQTIDSIKRLQQIPAKVCLTAHETGVFVAPPARLWERYIDVIRQREDKLLAFLSHPRTMAEIVDQWITYGKARKPREFYEFGERAHMQKHLERLMACGVVACGAGRYGRVDQGAPGGGSPFGL